MTRTVVTAGSSIDPASIRRLAPAAEVVPPIAFGDAFGYQLGAGDRLLIIDGLFLQRPAVRHKELLTLLDQDVLVAGCSSMGALRAAELHHYGMLGFGEIFADYRDGVLDADDEVGMVHGDAEDGYPVFVDALVNIRATLRAGAAVGLVEEALSEQLLAAARQLPFTARSWPQLMERAGVPAAVARPLAAALRRHRRDQKRMDAVTALGKLSESPRPVVRWQRPVPTIWSQRWAQRWQPPCRVPVPASEAGGPAEVAVRDIDVLAMLRLAGERGWWYEPALEQFAAWAADWPDPPPVGHQPPSVSAGVERALAGLDAREPAGRADDRLRKLERIAHRHLQQRGLCGPAGLPDQVLAHWLTLEERARALADPVRGSALVASRTLLHDPALPEIQYHLQLLRADHRYRQWQQLTAAAIGHGRLLAEQNPHLDLQRPRPDRLDALFQRRWQVTELDPEKAARGFATPESFMMAATPFAAAAASGGLVAVQVGRFGRS